jgi:[ribosomal protein S5]-alanine N-acetyltransferase
MKKQVRTGGIETPRMQLREVTPEVYAYVFSALTDQELKYFFGYETDEDLFAERQRFHNGLSMFNKTFINFHLIEKETNNFIGSCGYHTWYLQHNRAEIGYKINGDSFMGKGFMTEALQAIIPYGFERMNLHRIEAFVGPRNLASLRLMKKFGFTEEGKLREHYVKNGVAEDSLVFSLLKREYK